MSNKTSEFPSDVTGLSSKQSSVPNGLESIALVALQALQNEHLKKVEDEISNSNLPTTTMLPPLPTNRDPVSLRMVSTDSFGEANCVDDIEILQKVPRAKEVLQAKDKDTSLPPGKALSAVPCSPPVGKMGTSAIVLPSPSASPLRSTSTTQTKVPDEDPNSNNDSAKAIAEFSRILADPEGWLLQTEDKFAKLPPVDRSSDNDIVVQPNDVLCGRGGETNHHPGNIRYRSLVKAYQKLYLLAKRRDKPKIAQCIVVSVRGVNGRFLKRTKNANTAGPTWVDVGNVKAREKTSQALREGAPNLRENVNPPLTSNGVANDSTANNARPVPDQTESRASPSASSTSLPPNTQTALHSMIGWAAFNNANSSTTAANGSSSPMTPVSSPSLLSSSDADIEALTAQVFTKNAAQLMQHPAFHQLDQARQQEAILFELKNAKATVESAKKRTSMLAGKTASAIKQEHGRTSPMKPSTSITQVQQQPRRAYNHKLEYPYYHQGQHPYHALIYNYCQDGNAGSPKNPSGMDRKPDQVVSRVVGNLKNPSGMDRKPDQIENKIDDIRDIVAKAAATCYRSHLSSPKKVEDKCAADGHQQNTKKRPAPSSTSHVQSTDSGSFSAPLARTTSLAVVSDTGSDISSSASSCSSTIANNFESLSAFSLNANNCSSSKDKTPMNNEKTESFSCTSRGGSRLKRLKLRMKNDFD